MTTATLSLFGEGAIDDKDDNCGDIGVEPIPPFRLLPLFVLLLPLLPADSCSCGDFVVPLSHWPGPRLWKSAQQIGDGGCSSYIPISYADKQADVDRFSRKASSRGTRAKGTPPFSLLILLSLPPPTLCV